MDKQVKTKRYTWTLDGEWLRADGRMQGVVSFEMPMAELRQALAGLESEKKSEKPEPSRPFGRVRDR